MNILNISNTLIKSSESHSICTSVYKSCIVMCVSSGMSILAVLMRNCNECHTDSVSHRRTNRHF
jgi:hypothetical protein